MASTTENSPDFTPADGSAVDPGAASNAPSSTTAGELAAYDVEHSVKYDQGWLTSFTRPFLIAILATCLNIALLTVLQRLMPSLSPAFGRLVLVLGIVAALVGCVTTTWLAQPAQRMKRSSGYRAAEVGLLLVVTRLLVWAVAGNVPTLGALFTAPLSSLVDGPFVVGAVVVGISWFVATELSDDLLAMALQPDEIKAAESGTLYRETVRPAYMDRRALLNSFATRWIVGGVLLVLLAAGANMGFSSRGFLAIARQNIAPAVITAVIVYFLVGLMLLSQGQLAILRARWALEQTPTRETILRSWPIYAMVVLVVIGALAALMPFGGTYWLARFLSMLIAGVYFVVFFVFQLFGLLFALLMSLLPFEESAEAPPPPPVEPMIPPPQEAASSEFMELAGSTIFWVIALVIVGYAAYVYFTDKGVRFTWLTWLWQMVRGRWRHMTSAYGDWQRSRVGGSDGDNDGRGGRRRRRWFPWRRRPLDADAQARYYYHAMLDEASARKDVARQRAETPLRFAPRLIQALPEDPDAESSVDGLTDAFIRVRYAERHIENDELPVLEKFWQQVRRIMRL